MKNIIACLFFCCIFQFSFSQTKASLESKRVHLPNGWSLTPVGKSLPLGDLPLNIAGSPSKKFIAVTNNGQSIQSIQLIDAVNDKVLSSIEIPKSWYGLKFSADEKYLYAAGGNDNWIVKYAIENKKLAFSDTIKLGEPWPYKIWPAGIEIDDAKKIMYVVTKENNSLYTINLKTKTFDSLALGAEVYSCLLSPDKKYLYISLWGGDKILIYDPQQKKIIDNIPVGDHPNDLCLTKNGKYLFVANANDNSVSVIDVANKKVIETLNAALYPDAATGSTTNSVALSSDEKTLYVANADNNCLAVFDVSSPGSSKSKGFIPVGWYPTCVRVIGNKIFVTNGKGFTSSPNPKYRPFDTSSTYSYQKGEKLEQQYIGGLFQGTLSIFNTPTTEQLGMYSQLVYQNTPYHKEQELTATGEKGNPVPQKVGDKSPIKYVFYIIKENRTYDQVLGDIPEGNGDPSLVLFGKNITPNEHAIAQQFVLLDNFYCDGEVSADGHSWSTGAYATDYLEKIWPTSYGGRGGSYDAEGTRKIANNKEYIWNACKQSNVTYRTYGEFADNYKPNIPVLKDHFSPYFTGWDLSVRDSTRYKEWAKEFDSLVAANALPQFNSLRFPNDHTSGLSKGAPTPFAHVADNDLAVGMFIEHLSKSPVWNQSVVFIIEDDAQNGPDHVDAHRTTAYVAGGFVKRHFVDHTMYSTSSMLRTIELILGLPPMTQYDAAATPMWRCFSNVSDPTGFTALPENIDLNKTNTTENAWQRKSETFDFSQEDRVPDLEFTEVIWKAVKGENAIVPAPKRAAFLKVNNKKDKDDDD
jgi:YVTN family beta-propeller protein